MIDTNDKVTEQAPIFIVGVNRSGTTLLSVMLNSHPDIAIPYESHFFVPYFKRIEQFGDLNDLDNRKKLMASILAEPSLDRWDYLPKIEDIDFGKFDSLQGAIAELYKAYAAHFGKTTWGDKSPSYTSEIHICHRLFPDAKYIHIIRDGRDVASSIVQQWWGPTDFVTALRYWERTITTCRKQLDMLPDGNFYEIRFEDLVRDPAVVLQSVLDFLGHEFSHTIIDAYVKTSAKQLGPLIDGQHKLLKTRPSASQAFKWRKSLSKADQAVAYDIAAYLLFFGLRFWRKATSSQISS